MKLDIRIADYSDPKDQNDLTQMLNQYAQDPFGGGSGIDATQLKELPARLADFGHVFTLLAYLDTEPVGIANCIWSFSTFKGRPVLNIHDFAVTGAARGRGVGMAMLEQVEDIARKRDCCKVSLEVLSGNEPAKALYRKFGFTDYQLEPEHGVALFWEKPL